MVYEWLKTAETACQKILLDLLLYNQVVRLVHYLLNYVTFLFLNEQRKVCTYYIFVWLLKTNKNIQHLNLSSRKIRKHSTTKKSWTPLNHQGIVLKKKPSQIVLHWYRCIKHGTIPCSASCLLRGTNLRNEFNWRIVCKCPCIGKSDIHRFLPTPGFLCSNRDKGYQRLCELRELFKVDRSTGLFHENKVLLVSDIQYGLKFNANSSRPGRMLSHDQWIFADSCRNCSLTVYMQ